MEFFRITMQTKTNKKLFLMANDFYTCKWTFNKTECIWFETLNECINFCNSYFKKFKNYHIEKFIYNV